MRTVEEIKAAMKTEADEDAFEELAMEYLEAVIDGIDPDRLEAICDAEREGRLVVLPNEPLTLDELRQMHGEPVWIVEHPDWGHWELSEDAEDYLVDRDEAFYDMTHNDAAGRYGLHALGWRAYRHKTHGARP